MVNKTTRTHKEAIDLVLWVELLDSVEDTTDYVVSTRSLTTRKDDTYVHLLSYSLFTWNELDKRHSVGVREHFLDFFLIAYTLCWLAFFYLNGTLKTLWQFWLISSSLSLQKTFFHFYNIFINS